MRESFYCPYKAGKIRGKLSLKKKRGGVPALLRPLKEGGGGRVFECQRGGKTDKSFETSGEEPHGTLSGSGGDKAHYSEGQRAGFERKCACLEMKRGGGEGSRNLFLEEKVRARRRRSVSLALKGGGGDGLSFGFESPRVGGPRRRKGRFIRKVLTEGRMT